MSPRVRRIHQAFVASTTLRPMAQQLIQDRTPAGYAGVEAYARAHSKEDAARWRGWSWDMPTSSTTTAERPSIR